MRGWGSAGTSVDFGDVPAAFLAHAMMRDVEPSRQHDDGEDDGRVPIVPYVAFRCPTCGRHKPFTYKVRARLRYHRCKHCGQRYRSFEIGADSVGNWTAPPSTTT